MKKIISLAIVLLLVFIVGCQYVVEDTSDQGVTYINISEIVSDKNKTAEKETNKTAVKEVVAEEPEEEVETTVKEIPTVKVTEGQTVSFPNLKATDPDGDKITYKFSAPLDNKGEWQTKEGDAGQYTAKITASDGISEAVQEVKIIVEQLNKAPVLEKITDITVNEGETIKFSPKALDPEGKAITITYSGWMTADTKKTDFNSAGTYVVRVTVSDGQKEMYQDVKVTVQDVNRPPVFTDII